MKLEVCFNSFQGASCFLPWFSNVSKWYGKIPVTQNKTVFFFQAPGPKSALLTFFVLRFFNMALPVDSVPGRFK